MGLGPEEFPRFEARCGVRAVQIQHCPTEPPMASEWSLAPIVSMAPYVSFRPQWGSETRPLRNYECRPSGTRIGPVAYPALPRWAFTYRHFAAESSSSPTGPG